MKVKVSIECNGNVKEFTTEKMGLRKMAQAVKTELTRLADINESEIAKRNTVKGIDIKD